MTNLPDESRKILDDIRDGPTKQTLAAAMADVTICGILQQYSAYR